MLKDTLGYLLLPLCFFLFSFNLEAKRENRILNFHTDIRMDTSGRADITETIKVLYTKQQPRKEIVRKITNYRYGDKNPEVEIHVDSVLRNGEIKKYSTTNEYTKFSIEIDNERKKLQPGIYEYTFKYWSDNFFDYNHQSGELIWDVNGNDLFFEIDSISATVHLPKGSKSIANECNILITGECSYKNIGDTVIEFYGNQTLPSFRNFKIGTSFTPKVIEETILEDPVVDTDLLAKMTFAVIAVMLCLFLLFWWLINTMNGRVVARPTAYPPLGKSPASMRVIFKSDTDTKGLAVCLLSMAVKKAILIKRVGKKTFTFTSLGNKDQLSEEELAVYNQLYKRTGQDVSMGMTINSIMPQDAYRTMREALKPNYTKYILSKSPYIARFVLLSLCFMILWFAGMYYYSGVYLPLLLDVIILSSVTYFSYIFGGQISKLDVNVIIICFFTLVGIPFIYWIFDSYFWFAIGTALALIFINSLFMRLINPSSKSGNNYRADLEGFRMSMTIKTNYELEYKTHHDLTPDYFEEMLPYAVALDMEDSWVKKFAQTSILYQPSWYLGQTGNSYLDYIEIIKSLRSAINCNVLKSR